MTAKWALLGALLVCLHLEASAQDFSKVLKDLSWTCPAPIEEDVQLNETLIGKSLVAQLFASIRQATDSSASARQICSFGCIPTNETCKFREEVCVGVVRHVFQEQYHRLCSNSTWAEADQKCADVTAGKFCVIAQDEGSGEMCVLMVGDQVAQLDCPDGFYCVGKGAQPRACRKGKFCPANSTQEAACPSGSFCLVAALPMPCNESVSSGYGGLKCMPDDDQKTVLPEPCPKGEYCEHGRSNSCPAGSYCPQGASAPVPCESLETCPAGSWAPGRLLKSMLASVGVLFSLGALACTMDFWCLPSSMRWVRLPVFVIILLALWASEWRREHQDLTVAAYLTALFCCVVWGTIVSPRYRELFGTKVGQALDCVAYLASTVAAALLAEDIMVGCFIALLLPAAFLQQKVLADDSLPMYFKISLLCAGIYLCVLEATLVVFFASRDGAVPFLLYTFILVLIFVDTGVRCWLTRLWPARFARPVLLDNADEPLAAAVVEISEVSWQRPLPYSTSETSMLELGSSASGASASDASASGVSSSGASSHEEVSGPAGPAGVSIQFRKVSLLLGDGRRIIDDVSFHIPPGCSVAVMGPSGCGKSSITNVLSGRAGYGSVEGEILINGDRNHSVDKLRSVTGFVPQDDVMHRNLTVEENVMFQAEMRMPREKDDDLSARGQQVEKEVDRVLDKLGLGEPRLRTTQIGDEATRGVSGGQRKRVSIAMELVARPSLLFLDEPTSGLDSTTSHSVVEIITRTARESRCTTLAVIHQPRYETLLLFDRVVLLAAGGHLVYSGPSVSAYNYFEQALKVRFPEKANPADTFMDAVTLESAWELMRRGEMVQLDTADRQAFGKALASNWRHHGAKAFGHVEASAMKLPLPALDFQTCTWGEEIFVQVKRAALQFRREAVAVIANNLLLVFGLFCLCLGWPSVLPSDEIMHPLLALMLMMLTQGVAAQRIFGGVERPVCWREAGSSVDTIFYFIGRDMAALMDITVGTFTFILIYWPLGPLLVEYHNMVWVIFSFSYVVWGMNYIWSVLMPAGSAQMLAVVSAFTSQLIGGVQPSFTSLAQAGGENGVYLMAISPIRWAHGALMQKHMLTTHSQFSNEMIKMTARDTLDGLGMPLSYIQESGWTCDTGRSFLDFFQHSMLKRWRGDPKLLIPPNSFVCSTKQLILLGLYYRFVALMCLLIVSRLRVRGGGRLLDAGDNSEKGAWVGHLLRRLLWLWFVAFTHAQMALLLMTT